MFNLSYIRDWVSAIGPRDHKHTRRAGAGLVAAHLRVQTRHVGSEGPSRSLWRTERGRSMGGRGRTLERVGGNRGSSARMKRARGQNKGELRGSAVTRPSVCRRHLEGRRDNHWVGLGPVDGVDVDGVPGKLQLQRVGRVTRQPAVVAGRDDVRDLQDGSSSSVAGPGRGAESWCENDALAETEPQRNHQEDSPAWPRCSRSRSRRRLLPAVAPVLAPVRGSPQGCQNRGRPPASRDHVCGCDLVPTIPPPTLCRCPES